MVRVLVVGPDHSPPQRDVLATVDAAVRAQGHATVGRAPPDPAQGLKATLSAVESCDALVAVLDGADVDAATAILVGYAYAHRRPVLGLRSDQRAGPGSLIEAACARVPRISDWKEETLRGVLGPFLAGVRVYAGTLVRDAVPKILEDEGRALKFRPVDATEYPAVLKRKLVETARRLEDADFGVEQEEIADVLELLETLINLRQYDKESLRSIKEGKWRRRGGFERGLLLDEEPALTASSR